MEGRYSDALAELELYKQEMEGDFSWVEETRKKKPRPAQKVPNRETVAEMGTGPGKGEKETEDTKDTNNAPKQPEKDKKKEKTGLSGPMPKGRLTKAFPFLHYREYEQAVPYVSVETAEAAADAIRELEELKASIPEYLVTYIDDDGHRQITKTVSLKDAKVFAETQLQEALDALEEEGRMQEVYIDDGSGGPYPPTPEEYINDDESHKCEADALGLLHVFRGDMHYIIYNELAGKTSRWDIFPVKEARDYQSRTEEDTDESNG